MVASSQINSFTLELGQGSELGLGLALATMMFSVALNLRPSSFEFLRSNPRSFLVGVLGQLVALPLVTILLCMALDPPASVALGMILVASCPGGNVSNMLVLLARGNTALSVSLTATSSLAAAFVTPVAVLLWSSLYAPTAQLLSSIDFDSVSFLLQTAIVLALPLLLGILCHVYLPSVARRIQAPLVFVSSLTLLLIILLGALKYWNEFMLMGVSLIGIVAIHNACAFALGNSLARLSGASVADRRALTFEVGIQNAGLGIVILLTQMNGLGGAAIVAGLWGIWHIVAGLALVCVFRLSE